MLHSRKPADVEAPAIDEKSGGLPVPNTQKDHVIPTQGQRIRQNISYLPLIVLGGLVLLNWDGPYFPKPAPPAKPTPAFVKYGLEQCEALTKPMPDVSTFSVGRQVSDRFEKGTKAVLLKNGTLWTAGDKGKEIIYGGSVWLDGGVQRKVGKDDEVMAAMVAELSLLGKSKDDVKIVELNGKWVTPGIVDMHSHGGVDSAPHLSGADDTNSLKAPVLPFLRSVDGYDTHDNAFPLMTSGGITTHLVLPGSAGNIGGQAFVMKPRPTKLDTPGSMSLEAPWVVERSGNTTAWKRTGHYRHSKHACGENPSRVYGQTRMDSFYQFRNAYTQGKKLMDAQDKWCEKGESNTDIFPEDLDWEMLADTIRGRVRVNTHCYQTDDIEDLINLTNEFKFRLAAIHHAHEAYMLPDTIKNAYGAGDNPPAIAIFATNANYKRESYRGSEYAPYILHEAGLPVVMKSDHPVLNSQYLRFEATQAASWGLPQHVALSSLTSTPAKAIAKDHRIGHLKAGYDADVVVWDSYPLVLGATPVQTYIDGIPQIETPVLVLKPESLQSIPKDVDVKAKAAEALKYRGLPPRRSSSKVKNVVFQGVQSLYLKGALGQIQEEFLDLGSAAESMVVVKDGEITCTGACAIPEDLEFELIDLKGGSISTGLVTYGSPLGLAEIAGEKSTWDGVTVDALTSVSPLVDGLVIRGADGALFDGKDQLIAYQSGVTVGVAHPIAPGLIDGISYSYATDGRTPLDGIKQEVAAVHASLGSSTTKVSSSTHIAVLRNLLKGQTGEKTELTKVFKRVAAGEIPLVIDVQKADIMGALIRLKREIGGDMKMVFEGAAESHLLADEISEANIGVIVTPPRSYPDSWDDRRIMVGPPLTNMTLPTYLASRGVTVALGIVEGWASRLTRLEAAWTMLNSAEVFTKSSALDLVSTNLEKLLGLDASTSGSWVAWEGDLFGIDAKVKAVRGVGQKAVDLF